jgi:Icc-related predicted phosphoesterase
VIRVAAVADIHFGTDSAGSLRPHLDDLASRADVLLVAGDLTRRGYPDEAEVLGAELEDLGLRVYAVLGNHDLHVDRGPELCKVLDGFGVQVLDGETVVLRAPDGERVGIAGVKGFGVGFRGASSSDFGEPIVRAWFAHARDEACCLEDLLHRLAPQCDVRIALMHYAPVEATLQGERPEIWAFLGSYLLGEAVDRAGADLALHGHAHAGSERGETPGGVPVRNVAQPVIRTAYRLYCLGRDAELGCE